jgi:hypothetical protein
MYEVTGYNRRLRLNQMWLFVCYLRTRLSICYWLDAGGPSPGCPKTRIEQKSGHETT